MTFEQQRDLLIEKIRQHMTDGRFAGMTPHEAALAMGALPDLAVAVQQAWDGPPILR